MESVITIGGATQDIFLQQTIAPLITYKSEENKTFLLLEEGTKIDVSHVHFATGGGATNSAVAFKRQGFPVSAFFKIGNDSQGVFIIEYLMREGIDSSLHTTSATKHTGISCILPSPSGNRTIFVYRGANGEIQPQDIPYHAITQHSTLYITSLTENTTALLPPLVKHAKQHNKLVATNPGSCQLQDHCAHLIESLPFIDIFILNSAEARLLVQELMDNSKLTHKQSLSEKMPPLFDDFAVVDGKPVTLGDYFSLLNSLGPRIVIVTDGEHGVYVGTKQAAYYHPSLHLDATSTVGAGDAFGATFVGSIMKNFSIEEAIVRSIINSAHVVQSLDAKEGLLYEQELDSKSHNYGTSQLQVFKNN